MPFTAQPIGQPEICKMSLKECRCVGGEEIFIIGKNFLRGTRVFFQQVVDEQVQWEKEGEIDKDYFQTVSGTWMCEMSMYSFVLNLNETLVFCVQLLILFDTNLYCHLCFSSYTFWKNVVVSYPPQTNVFGVYIGITRLSGLWPGFDTRRRHVRWSCGHQVRQ